MAAWLGNLKEYFTQDVLRSCKTEYNIWFGRSEESWIREFPLSTAGIADCTVHEAQNLVRA